MLHVLRPHFTLVLFRRSLAVSFLNHLAEEGPECRKRMRDAGVLAPLIRIMRGIDTNVSPLSRPPHLHRCIIIALSLTTFRESSIHVILSHPTQSCLITSDRLNRPLATIAVGRAFAMWSSSISYTFLTHLLKSMHLSYFSDSARVRCTGCDGSSVAG